MSINVTVTGNPVSINRGKMVTACKCSDPQKDEFDKRRLMRLEQVRQQSKEIAENVRNKVRKEKQKQCCEFDRDNEKKLRDWQARKLLALHNQYQESLQNMGLGHKEAEIYDIIEEDIEEEKERCAKIAAERGRLARQNLKYASASKFQQGKFRREPKSADALHRGNCTDNCWCNCNQKKHFYTVVGATDPANRESPIQVSLKTSSCSHSTSSSGQYDIYRPYASAAGDKSRPVSPQLEKDTASSRRKISSETSEAGFSSGSPKKFISQLADISEASDGSSPRRFPSGLVSDRDIADSSEMSEGAKIMEGLRKYSSQVVRNDNSVQPRRAISESLQKRLSSQRNIGAPAIITKRKTSSKLQAISDDRRREFGSKINEELEESLENKPKTTTSGLRNRESDLEPAADGKIRKSSSVQQKVRREEFDLQLNEESEGFSENRPKTTASGTQKHKRNDEVTVAGRIKKSSTVLRKEQGARRSKFDSQINEESEGFSENRQKTTASEAQKHKNNVEVTADGRIRKSSSVLHKDQDGRRRESGSKINEASEGVSASRSKGTASESQKYERNVEVDGRKRISSSAAPQRRKEFSSQMDIVERTEFDSEMNEESVDFTESHSKKRPQRQENDVVGGKTTAREITETVEGNRPRKAASAVVANSEKTRASTEAFAEKRPRKVSTNRDADQNKASNTIPYPIETRISDRIKHRSTLSTAAIDLCDTLPEELPQQTYRPIIRSNPDLSRPVSARHIKPTVTQNETSASLEIPEKSEVIGLKGKRDTADGVSTTTDCNRLTCSDYQKQANRFVQTRANVERIDEEQVQVVNYENEDDDMKKMERQDREAEERGRQAWQKEKTKRDYEDLMKKLPVLQKQESMNRICSNRSNYHMSEERLREMEGKRQFQVENAFENAFPNLKPNLITTQGTSQEDVENEPFRVISVGEKNQGISVGTWDVTMKGNAREEIDCECCSPENQTKREKQLRELLLSLQAQKEMLLKEVDGLPKDSKLNELLGSLHDISAKQTTSILKKTSTVKEKKRSLEEISPSSSSSSSTPRKKSKTKCKRCVLIRQNMSTQTSPVAKSDAQVGDTAVCGKIERSTSPLQPPKVASKSTSPTQSHICPQTGHICDTDEDKCKSTDDKLCEIVIKIHENEPQPEILIKPVAKLNKKVERTADKVVIMDKKPVRRKSVEVCAPTCTGDHAKKWREQLSQYSSNYSTSSTSYYSPPEETLFEEEPRKRSQLRDVLQEKPKQTNLASHCTATSAPCRKTQTARKLHPFITKYIDKLLSMSRTSIEDLSVSSVSDVTTPTSSLMELNPNATMNHLKKLLRRLGITYEELHEMYGKTGKHESVLSSLPTTSSTSTSITNDILQHRVDGGCCETQDEYTNTCLSAKVSKCGVSEEEDEKYCEMMTKYAEIANSCNRRISNLTAMIEKVRSEKAQIMNTPDSSDPIDKDNTTTAYLDLPRCNTSSENSAAEQERLDKMLLTIDESFAENLKRMSSGEIRERYQIADVQLSREDINEDSVADVRQRYRLLMSADAETFEPVLNDIPKFPLLCECPNKRPPPSKGLTAAKKFNEDITGIPHELSTIMEGDSQISTKAPKSNDELPENANISHKSTETSTPDILREITANFREGTAATIPPENCNTKKEVVFDTNVQVQPLNSSSSEDMESLEKMLKEMGMGWALVTLRKTQEALALASSSSSLDVNIRTQKGVQFSDSSGSTSEISLKGVMSRHLLTKISSTTSSSSETSISLLMKEFEDISAILGSGSTTKDGRRTSTPIQSVPAKSKICTCNRSGSGSDDNKTNCAFHNNDFVSR